MASSSSKPIKKMIKTSDTDPVHSLPKRVLCVGMCVMDFIHLCESYPVEDSDGRTTDGYIQRGGNASNNCTVLKQLGTRCEFLGMLSCAPGFTYLKHDFKHRDILTENCPTTTQNAPFSSIILNSNRGTRTIVHTNSNFPILEAKHFTKLSLSNYGWIHFEARNVLETTAMLNRIHEYNDGLDGCEEKIIISVELEKKAKENFPIAAMADYVFVGKDLAQCMGMKTGRQAVNGIRNALLDVQYRNNEPTIICAWGDVGVSCIDSQKKEYFKKSITVDNIIDSLGAGDTFNAAFIHATYTMALNLTDAINFANKCAAYKLKYRGFDELSNFTSLDD